MQQSMKGHLDATIHEGPIPLSWRFLIWFFLDAKVTRYIICDVKASLKMFFRIVIETSTEEHVVVVAQIAKFRSHQNSGSFCNKSTCKYKYLKYINYLGGGSTGWLSVRPSCICWKFLRSVSPPGACTILLGSPANAGSSSSLSEPEYLHKQYQWNITTEKHLLVSPVVFSFLFLLTFLAPIDMIFKLYAHLSFGRLVPDKSVFQ